MRIVEASLHQLVTFKFAEIHKLSVTFSHPLQIVLGTNGCGKSNLLRQLTPRCPVRRDYETGGYRRLVIEHQNHTYTLTSDFSNKSSPHSFVTESGENLNEGGTTGVQDELIESYLGWTPRLEAIMSIGYDFVAMSAGLRKVLLIESNPARLGFILDDQKRVSSKIRACKNNLSMLQDRKIDLEAKMIDQSAFDQLSTEQKQLENDTQKNVVFISQIKSELQRLPIGRDYFTQGLIDQTVALRKEIVEQSALWSDLIDRDQPSLLVELKTKIQMIDDQIHQQETLLTDVTQELNHHQQTIDEMSDEDALVQLRLRISTLQKDLLDLEGQRHPNALRREDLLELDELLPTLQTILESFAQSSVTLMTPKVFQLKSQKLQHIEFQLSQCLREQDQLQRRQDYLKRSQSIRMSDIPKENCAQMACPLYANFKNTYDEVVAEFQRNKDRLRHLMHFSKRAQHYGSLQSEQLDHLRPMMNRLNELSDLIRSYPVMNRFVKGKSLLIQLKLNPLQMIHQIRHEITLSENTHRYQELSERLRQEEIDLSKHASASDGEKLKIKLKLDQLTQNRNDLCEKLKSLRSAREIINHEYHRRQLFMDLYQHAQQHQKLLDEALIGLSQTHQRRMLEDLLSTLQQHQSRCLLRLGEISVTLKEQDNIKARYEEEILKQITKIELEKKDWEVLESALKHIPYHHTVTFINALISLMNAYISKIFVYDFKLLHIAPHQSLDYTFPVQIGDLIIDDISTCSKAQSEMINLAFCLALRRLLGLSDYPIYLDETGASFDVTHKYRLIDLLNHLLEDHHVSQMFLVNHHESVHEGLANKETLVLSDTNIMVPVVYNTHAVFN